VFGRAAAIPREVNMANEGMANFQIPPEMRAFAEQSMEQAKRAFDGFVTAAQGALSQFEGQAAAAQAGAKDMQQKAVGFAESNVAASFEFAQKLLRAKDSEEIMKLHADYVKTQLQALAEQAKDLGQSAAKAAAVQPKT
jgi:phasin